MANICTLNRIFLSVPSISRLLSLLLATVIFVTALVGMPSVAWAQTARGADSVLIAEMVETAETAETAETIETAQTITDGADIAAEKVDQFAQAYLQVLQLLNDREPELPAAETSTEALAIQQSIESDAIAIIQTAGLTMPEYMQILGLASQDEAFQDKVLGRMDESTDDR